MSPKTALVLSAGGMFGAWQAGAWKVLTAGFRPDAIIGASVGSLNAWAIAGGIEPEDLIRYWLDPVTARFAAIRPSSRGVFDARPLEARIEALWQAYRPRCEIGVVAVELASLRPRLFRNDEITWRHLAASCAVLLCYPQVRLDGRLYTDGGLLGSLPLWAAAEMGARRIVALDALPQAPSRVVRAAVGGFRAVAPPLPGLARDVEVLSIAPERPLGNLRRAIFWNEAAARRLISQGMADAEMATREWTAWP